MRGTRATLEAEVVVVGAGIMGLAAGHALAREGVDALVLDQFPLGHGRGSSHGATRVFRLAYTEPEWVRLAQQALAAWRALEAESGEELLSLTGLVELVRHVDESSGGALEECGVAWEPLEPAEAERRFPVRVPPGLTVVHQPEAGVVHAGRAHTAYARALRVLPETRVLSLDPLETTAGRIKANAVVVTAGAWARDLLGPAGIELDVVPTRETVAYFRLAANERIPVVAELGRAGHGFYALRDPGVGLKVGFHRSGPTADPDEEGRPDPEVVHRVAEWAGQVFELADPKPAAVETCLYTNRKDERFVLARHGRIVVGSACSGHGFKFAPIVGRRLGELALEALA